jgi:hypothetical protein
VSDPRGPICRECHVRHMGRAECDPRALYRTKNPIKFDYEAVDGPDCSGGGRVGVEIKGTCPRCNVAKLGLRYSRQDEHDTGGGWQCENRACGATVRQVQFKRMLEFSPEKLDELDDAGWSGHIP